MAASIISTVVTPAESYDLVALDDMKVELGIPAGNTANDTFLAQKITEASSAVQDYCNRVFVQETVQDVFLPDRQTTPFGSLGRFSPLQLSRYPVSNVTSVTVQPEDGGTPFSYVLGTDYLLDGKAGQLIKLTPTGMPSKWYPLPTTLVFLAGFATLPGAITSVVKQIVTGTYQRRGRDPFLKSTDQAGGVGRREYWVPNSGVAQGQFSPDMLDVLNLFRVPVNA